MSTFETQYRPAMPMLRIRFIDRDAGALRRKMAWLRQRWPRLRYDFETMSDRDLRHRLSRADVNA
jgi:hypothetical protein